MENIKPKFESLVDHIKDYVNNRIELAKLMAIEKGANGISNAATILIFVLLGIFFIIFFSITLAIVLSMVIGVSYSGFLIVTLLYLITALILFYNKQKWMIEPFANIFIKQALKDYNNENKQANVK